MPFTKLTNRRQTDKETHRLADKQTYRQLDKQAIGSKVLKRGAEMEGADETKKRERRYRTDLLSERGKDGGNEGGREGVKNGGREGGREGGEGIYYFFCCIIAI
jgi:hypothetical protein